MAAEDGGVPVALWSAHFALYNPFVPAGECTSPTGLPRYDVSVYTVDSRTFETFGTGLGIEPEPIVDAPLELHDPAGYTVATPTWGAASADQLVLVLGFPDLEDGARHLHASVGRVLGAFSARKRPRRRSTRCVRPAMKRARSPTTAMQSLSSRAPQRPA